MSPQKIALAFLPLIAYSLLAPVGVAAAALIALSLALGLVGLSLVRGESPKLIGLASGGVFALFLVVVLMAPPTAEFLGSYGRALAPLAIAGAIFALLPVMPFTEQYARETVPQQYWHEPAFRALNRKLSALWGSVIAAQGVGHALQEALFVHRPGLGALAGWGLPFLVLLVALHATKKATADAHRGAHERSRAAA